MLYFILVMIRTPCGHNFGIDHCNLSDSFILIDCHERG